MAEPPTTAVKSDPPSCPLAVMVVGSLLGVVAAGAVAYLLDLLDSTARTADDIQGILTDEDVPILGQGPVLAAAGQD